MPANRSAVRLEPFAVLRGARVRPELPSPPLRERCLSRSARRANAAASAAAVSDNAQTVALICRRAPDAAPAPKGSRIPWAASTERALRRAPRVLSEQLAPRHRL